MKSSEKAKKLRGLRDKYAMAEEEFCFMDTLLYESTCFSEARLKKIDADRTRALRKMNRIKAKIKELQKKR